MVDSGLGAFSCLLENHLCKASIQLILAREIINVYLDDERKAKLHV